MSEKPFQDADAAIRWITNNCRTCKKTDKEMNCDIVKSLIFSYVRLNGDIPYGIYIRMGDKERCKEYEKGKK